MYALVLSASALKSHQDHGIQCIDRRHEERVPVPVVPRLAERKQCIVAPGIFLVRVPGMGELLPDTGGKPLLLFRGKRGLRPGRYGAGTENKGQRKQDRDHGTHGTLPEWLKQVFQNIRKERFGRNCYLSRTNVKEAALPRGSSIAPASPPDDGRNPSARSAFKMEHDPVPVVPPWHRPDLHRGAFSIRGDLKRQIHRAAQSDPPFDTEVRAPGTSHAAGMPSSRCSVVPRSRTRNERTAWMKNADASASDMSPDVLVPRSLGCCSSTQVPSGVAWSAYA